MRILLLLFASLAFAQHFFPERPKTGIKKMDGVLLDYGAGTGEGGFSIRDDAGKSVYFYLGYPMRSGGKRIYCMSAPEKGAKPEPGMCDYWPPEIRVGETKVRVTYWEVKKFGEGMVKASDQIEVVSTAGGSITERAGPRTSARPPSAIGPLQLAPGTRLPSPAGYIYTVVSPWGSQTIDEIAL